jgi:CheY-like chemotaxis protein
VELVAPAQTFWWESVMADQKQSIILVVDEEPQILRLVRLILSREGWRVVCARSIREGIRLCRRAPGRVALALVDALTAEAHGPDWLDGLRAESEDLKVVLMSAGAPPDQARTLWLCRQALQPGRLVRDGAPRAGPQRTRRRAVV